MALFLFLMECMGQQAAFAAKLVLKCVKVFVFSGIVVNSERFGGIARLFSLLFAQVLLLL